MFQPLLRHVEMPWSHGHVRLLTTRRTAVAGGTIVVALVILAGAMLSGAPRPSQGSRVIAGTGGPEPGFGFGSVRDVLSTCGTGQTCYEPSIAADGSGRWYVTWLVGDRLAVLDNDGVQPREGPPPPRVLPAPASRTSYGDAWLTVGPGERLYMVRMVFAFGQEVGVQVAASVDAARSWELNTLVSPLGAPAQPVADLDRPWVAFGPEGEAYLAYHDATAGTTLWVARSDDGGRTFAAPVLAATPVDRLGALSPSGPPAIDPEGRVYLPYFADERLDGTFGARTVRVAVSSDGGRTYASHVAWAAKSNGTLGGYWPTLAIAPDGSVLVSWVDDAGALNLARSNDHGTTWAHLWNWTPPEGRARLQPWLAVRGASSVLGWFSENEGHSAVLAAARLSLSFDAPAAGKTAAVTTISPPQRGSPARTDYPALALGPDGRAGLAWADGGVMAAFERSS